MGTEWSPKDGTVSCVFPTPTWLGKDSVFVISIVDRESAVIIFSKSITHSDIIWTIGEDDDDDGDIVFIGHAGDGVRMTFGMFQHIIKGVTVKSPNILSFFSVHTTISKNEKREKEKEK
jgi:hypothetical protein